MRLRRRARFSSLLRLLQEHSCVLMRRILLASQDAYSQPWLPGGWDRLAASVISPQMPYTFSRTGVGFVLNPHQMPDDVIRCLCPTDCNSSEFATSQTLAAPDMHSRTPPKASVRESDAAIVWLVQ